jgi:hypothetical protein
MVRSAALALLVPLLLAAPMAAEELWVPVVAQIEGAEGSYWNTELWLANLSAGTGTCAVTFLPAGADNTEALLAEATPVNLPPGEITCLKDVVPPRSTGALRVVTSDGVAVRCRLYNAKGHGAVGQIIPAMNRRELVPADARAHLFPLMRSPQSRTNVGLLNPGSSPIRVRATVLDSRGQTVGGAEYPLAPGSQTQINDFLLAFRIERAEGHSVVLSAAAPFAAYASIVDSRTGAPTLILPEIE